jgi:hypothetical protein
MRHLKAIYVAAALIALFCASFSIMWWRRDQLERAASDQTASIEPVPVTPPQAAVTPSLQRAPADPVAPAPAQSRILNSRPVAAAPESPASDADGGDLPVVVGIVKKSDIFRDSSTNYETVRKKVYEGVVSTASDKPLTITVIDTDVPSQESSQATFVLASRGEKHFGVHDGLAMASGDQITLRSPPYHDLIQQIP